MEEQQAEFQPSDYLRSSFAITLFFLLLPVLTLLVLVLLILSAGYLTNFCMRYIGPILTRPVLAAAGIKFRMVDQFHPASQPVVYIINHGSTLDLLIIIALGLPRVRFVAKHELQYNPLFFLLGHLTGQVFIKREQSKRAVKILKRAYRKLKKRRLSVLMAPEGTRKHSAPIGPFKKGPFRIAVDLNYPIVPIYVEGARKLCRGASLVTRPGHITAYIKPAIDISNWDSDHLAGHVREVHRLYLQWAGISRNKLSVA